MLTVRNWNVKICWGKIYRLWLLVSLKKPPCQLNLKGYDDGARDLLTANFPWWHNPKLLKKIRDTWVDNSLILFKVCAVSFQLCVMIYANQGKRLLNAAMNALRTVPNSVNSESSSTVQHENIEEKPPVLWRELYIQKITMVCFSSRLFISCSYGCIFFWQLS